MEGKVRGNERIRGGEISVGIRGNRDRGMRIREGRGTTESEGK